MQHSVIFIKCLRREFHELLCLFRAAGQHLPGFQARDFGLQIFGGFVATAQDILDYLPLAMKMDRAGLADTLRDRYIGAQIV